MAKKSSSKMSSDVVSSDSRKRMPSSGSREHAECVLISDESDAEQEYQPERPRAKRSKPIIVRQPEEQADSRSSTEPESGSDHDKSKRTGTPTPEPSEDEREEVTVVSCLKESLPGETRSEATPSPSERTDDSSNEPSTSAVTLEGDPTRKFPKLLQRRTTSDFAVEKVAVAATPIKTAASKNPSKTLGFTHAAHGKPLSSIIKPKLGTPMRTAALQKQTPISSIVKKTASPSTNRRFGLAKTTSVPPMHSKERLQVQPRAPRTVVIDTKTMDDEEGEDGEFKENMVKTRLLSANSKEEREAYMMQHFTEGYIDDGDTPLPTKLDDETEGGTFDDVENRPQDVE